MNPSSWFGAAGDNSFLQVPWEDGERAFRRRWRDDVDDGYRAVLAVLSAAELPPAPGSLNRVTHEYRLNDDLGDAWAARPLELARERGRTSREARTTSLSSHLFSSRFTGLWNGVTHVVELRLEYL